MRLAAVLGAGLWTGPVARAAPEGELAQIAAFGEPRFAHPGAIVALDASSPDGRVRTLSGRSVWTWRADGQRSGEAPLQGCAAAAAGLFSEDGRRVAVRCDDPAASGVFDVTGVRLVAIDLDLSPDRPAVFCGSALWISTEASLVRIDVGSGVTRSMGEPPRALGCADGVAVAAGAAELAVFDATGAQIAKQPGTVERIGPGRGGLAAIVAEGSSRWLATLEPATGALTRGERLDGREAPAAVAAADGLWAVVRSGGVEVFDAEGRSVWQIGPPASALALSGGDRALWVVRGTRADRLSWREGRSATASLANRSAPIGSTGRDTWFGPGGQLLSRSDTEVVSLQPESGEADIVELLPPGQGEVARVRGGAFVVPAPDGVHLVSRLGGDNVLRAPGLARRATAPAGADRIGVVGTGDKGPELWIWRKLRAGSAPSARVRLPAPEPSPIRWAPGGSALWLATDDVLLRAAASGRTKRYELRDDWLHILDIGFTRGRKARWLGLAEVSRPGPDGRPEIRLGASPALELRGARGQRLASRRLPWNTPVAAGFVPGTLEVWVVSLDSGVLTLLDPSLEREIAKGRVPVLPGGAVSILWSPDGQRMVTEDATGRIAVWER